ncbi:Curli production assembly/transport component CsgG [Methylorubrum aminovorans]|uniref:Curli production assembly/transport component CsgG n=1 Tax=Methylorubrum aminovorans TaxID=269069 RepID=A0ABQ4UFX8_9HYPH|nr:CsgG/HfaB family protein [Methylorubrum aminovorans]GJE66174.1 Curli production assembly/transport component CsgG [Methylorubrum aminovorans]GMA76414.1 curli production assembly protein CsgG [Methylorubrum aminovorans]
MRAENLSIRRLVVGGLVCATLGLSGCVAIGEREPLNEAPTVTETSPTGLNLELLPPPAKAVDLAVYSFPDLTGQNKPSDNFAEFSRAVTQGGAAFLVDALRRTGGGRWFRVVERGSLANILQERQLIRATRQEFDQDQAKPLPPIRFAGLLVEGGILAYDANFVTGGIGARYLGIGGDIRYRRDVVTVGMRIVSVQSGEVLTSVTTTKTIYSIGLATNTFRYVAVNKLFEFDAGVTRNEPTQFAVRESIELAVYSTLMEGARKGLWKFRDPAIGQRLLQEYIERDKPLPPVSPTTEVVQEAVVVAKN